MKFIALIGRARGGRIVVDHKLTFPSLAENSRVNGARYEETDSEEQGRWAWPQDTWFQQRLALIHRMNSNSYSANSAPLR